MNLHKLIWGTGMLGLTLFIAAVPSGAQPRPGATPEPKKAPVDKVSTQSLRLSNSAACMLENGYMFLKYVLSQGLGELAAGNDSRNEAQSNALLRTTLRHLAQHPTLEYQRGESRADVRDGYDALAPPWSGNSSGVTFHHLIQTH